MRALWLSLAGLLALPACDKSDSGETGDTADSGWTMANEDCGCQLIGETPLALDEVSAAGFSAQDLLDLAQGSRAATLTWVTDASTDLTVTVADPVNARFRDNEAGECSNDMYYFCPDDLAVDVSMTFATGDGAFSEAWTQTLSRSEPSEYDYSYYDTAAGDSVSAWHSLDVIAGTFDPGDYVDVSEYDRVDVDLRINFYEGELIGGAIGGGGETSYGEGDEGVVSYTSLEFGEF